MTLCPEVQSALNRARYALSSSRDEAVEVVIEKAPICGFVNQVASERSEEH